MPFSVSTSKYCRNAIISIAFILLLLHLLTFPRAPFNVQHDSSSTATFEYYASKNVQFGTEVYQNIGPFGYVLYSDDYSGYLHWQKIILKSFSRLGLAILVFWMMGRLKQPTAKVCWFASLFLFYSFGDASNRDYLDLHDNYAYLTICLLAAWLLQNRNDWLFRVLSVAGWCFLAFISLNKNSLFVLSCGIATTILAQNLYRRNLVNTILGLVTLTVSLAFNWLMAGQHLENLPQFIRGVFTFTSCYNESMALITPIFPLLFGVTILSLLGVKIIVSWWQNKNEFGYPVIECFFLFIVWKHGFVRSDEHMLIFFYAVLLLVIPLYYYDPDNRDVLCKPNWVKAVCCATVYGLCMISFYAIIYQCHYKPVRLWNHLRDNISWLVAPLKKTQELEIRLAETKLRYALPGVKNLVGQESIDFFGYEPGYLLLNDLNYTSRPMPMTFATANKFLEEANEHFYRNPAKAPQFVLCQSGGVDNRLFIQDDALTKRALLDNYRPVIIENGLLLFKRKEITDWIPLRPDSEVKDQVIKFGQSIPLEKMNKSVVWLEVDIKHTLAGKLMTFFYKTPPCYINVQFEGEQQTHSYKFVTTMGDCGFMINPYLGSTSDIASYFDQRKNIEDMVRVASLSFEHNKLDRLFFKDSIHLKLRLLERPKN